MKHDTGCGIQKTNTEKALRLPDILLAGLVVLIAIGLFAAQHNEQSTGVKSRVRIEVSGKETRVIPFASVTDSLVLKVQAGAGQEIVVEISARGEDGKVRVARSTCPDKVCVRTGWISKPGQTIVCLPNKTVVRIEGDYGVQRDPGSGLDAITY